MAKCCHGLNCKSTDLIKAHIVPRGFARLAMDTGKIITIDPDRAPAVAKYQHGIFDPSILCASCDGKLGQFDDCAVEFCAKFLDRQRPFSDLGFQVRCERTDLLRKGILAIIWRASISKLEACDGVSLGSYERKVAEVLFGAASLNQLPQLQIVVQQYVVSFARSVNFYSLPHRMKFDNLNVYLFGLVGLRFLVKLDARPFPPELRDWVVNDKPRVLGTKIALSEASEGRALLDKAKSYRGYRRGK